MHLIPVLHSDEIQEDRPMPSFKHARVCQRLGVALSRFEGRLAVFQQLSLNLDGWESIPDVCLYLREVLPENLENDINEFTKAPLLAIEVLSPFQNLSPLIAKVQKYHAHGVASCWIVLPLQKAVQHLPANGPSRTYVDGAFRDEAAGIEIDVTEIFR